MNAVPALLLLAALAGAASGLFWKNFVFVDKNMIWTDAQEYCRENYVDLATLDMPWDYERFLMQASTDLSQWAWTGLSRIPGEEVFTLWSDGSVSENPYTPLDGNTDKNCVSTKNGYLYTYYCSERSEFFCYTWETNLVVVKEMMTWNEALDYCRTNYTDLINLDERTDQLVASKVNLDLKTDRFWTGLRFMDGSWFWTANMSEWTPASFPSCPERAFACGARKAAASTLENRDCEEKLNFICYDLNEPETDVLDLTDWGTDHFDNTAN